MSIFDPGKDVPDAPTWRCPHCRSLQPETSRCRACLRATVTCGTCRHFRPTLVNGLGLCADDPRRAPLGSDEVYPCWVSATDVTWSGSGLLEERGAVLPELASGPSAMPLDGHTAQPDPEPTDPPRAAEPGTGTSPRNEGLREAPHVAPARQLDPELRRRSVRGRG